MPISFFLRRLSRLALLIKFFYSQGQSGVLPVIKNQCKGVHMNHPLVRTFAIPLGLCLLLTLPAASSANHKADDKMEPKELIARHLESVGASAARAAVKSRVAVGICSVSFRDNRANTGNGRAVFASDGERNLIGMVFGYNEYPHDKIGYDGKKVITSYIKPGTRSSLGNFIFMNQEIFKQGLFGGTLSQSWPLFDPAVREAKLEFLGRKRLNDRDLYALRYIPKRGANVKVTLYFDDESFRHVRSEYEHTIVSRQGGGSGASSPAASADASAGQFETRYKLIEEFGEFREEQKLMLPHAYKLSLEIDGGRGSVRNVWGISLSQFAFNQEFEEGAFDVNRTGN